MKLSRSNFMFEYRSRKVRQRDGSREEGSDLPPTYVPFESLASLHGYQGIFGVTPEQAALNIRRGSTKGAKYAVFADALLIDFDDKPTEAEALEAYLVSTRRAFIRAHSGGRSDHFHVAIEPLYSPHAPYSLKQWILQHAPAADCSIYHRNGMFRLFGTRHEKTGRAKCIVRSFRGARLQIRVVEEPDAWDTSSGEAVSDLQGALSHVLSLLTCEPKAGNHHQSLWSAASSLLNAQARDGRILADVIPQPEQFIRGILRLINSEWGNYKDDADLERILRDLKIS